MFLAPLTICDSSRPIEASFPLEASSTCEFYAEEDDDVLDWVVQSSSGCVSPLAETTPLLLVRPTAPLGGVIDSFVLLLSEGRYFPLCLDRRGIRWLSTTVFVGKGCCSILPIRSY